MLFLYKLRTSFMIFIPANWLIYGCSNKRGADDSILQIDRQQSLSLVGCPHALGLPLVHHDGDGAVLWLVGGAHRGDFQLVVGRPIVVFFFEGVHAQLYQLLTLASCVHFTNICFRCVFTIILILTVFLEVFFPICSIKTYCMSKK